MLNLPHEGTFSPLSEVARNKDHRSAIEFPGLLAEFDCMTP